MKTQTSMTSLPERRLLSPFPMNTSSKRLQKPSTKLHHRNRIFLDRNRIRIEPRKLSIIVNPSHNLHLSLQRHCRGEKLNMRARS